MIKHIKRESVNTISFKVGDCVVLTEVGYEGRTGFIEEILITPDPLNPRKDWREGKFSIFSLNKDEYINGSKFYIGDTFGYNMTETGDVVTEDMLRSIMSVVPNNLGIARDFPVVIKNLGRERGKNE